MTSLNALRKATEASLVKMKNQTNEKQGDKSRYKKDDRLWKPTFNAEKGTGSAIVRFLPACPAEIDELPYQVVYSHYFQGPTGKYYIENSLSTLGEQDAVGAMNARLYKSGVKSDEEVAKKYSRKTNYYANVLIIKDPAHPENDGKVKIYNYGKEIAGILKDVACPVQEDDGLGDLGDPKESLNPFDVFGGADFVIKMKGKTLKNNGQEVTVPTYIASEFKKPSPLCNGDEAAIEAIWNQCHPLLPFIAPSEFKTKAELERKLVEVLGTRVGSGVPVVVNEDGEPVSNKSPSPTKPKVDKKESTDKVVEGVSDDDDLSFLMDMDD